MATVFIIILVIACLVQWATIKNLQKERLLIRQRLLTIFFSTRNLERLWRIADIEDHTAYLMPASPERSHHEELAEYVRSLADEMHVFIRSGDDGTEDVELLHSQRDFSIRNKYGALGIKELEKVGERVHCTYTDDAQWNL